MASYTRHVRFLSNIRTVSNILRQRSRVVLQGNSRCFASDVVEKKDSGEVTESQLPKTNTPFVKELFLGKFDKSMLTFPEVLEKEEQEELDAMFDPVLRFFKEQVDGDKIDREAKIPDEVLDQLKDMGLFGMQIPVRYGGLGMNATKFARMAEATALDPSIAVTLAGHQSIGLKGILINGNDEQKARYLPRLATGEMVAAFALTEPSSGSDAASIQSKAVLSEDERHYLLSGSKIWISNGGIADMFTVFAKTECTNFKGQKEEKVTAFIVERGFGGVTSGKPEDKMGIRGSNTAEVHFDETPVPIENVLGEVGGGFKVAMNILNSGRFSMGSSCAGGIRELIAKTAEHAINRQQFGFQLKEFELIKKKFAKMAVGVYAMESMAYRTAAILDSYQEPDASVEAAIVKVFSSETTWDLVSEGLQVLGGLGYMKEYPYERAIRDARINKIFEGTNEILRLYISLTCLQHAGGELRDIVKKMKNPLNNMSLLFKKMLERREHRKERPNLTLKLYYNVHPVIGPLSEELEIRVIKFRGIVEDYLSTYRDGILGEQLALERLADMAIDLYGMTCVLARSSRSIAIGLRNSDHEILLAQAFCQQACSRFDIHLQDLLLMKTRNGDEVLMKIADEVFENKGYCAEHPLTRNW